jgi:hypothetical protein
MIVWRELGRKLITKHRHCTMYTRRNDEIAVHKNNYVSLDLFSGRLTE